jgi:hypothetical protein
MTDMAGRVYVPVLPMMNMREDFCNSRQLAELVKGESLYLYLSAKEDMK